MDLFRTPFRLIMPGNTDQYRSMLGSIFTIITLMLLLSYASFKFSTLAKYEDYRLMEEVQQDYFKVTDEFSN